MAAVIKQRPFHRNLSESWTHTSSPLSTGDQFINMRWEARSISSHTHIYAAGAQWLKNGGIRSTKKEKKNHLEWVLTRAGSSFWLPELGCHVERGPKLALVNWPQLICSLNTAFRLFTPHSEMVLDVFSGLFPGKGNWKSSHKVIAGFYLSWFIPSNKRACMLPQTHIYYNKIEMQNKTVFWKKINK